MSTDAFQVTSQAITPEDYCLLPLERLVASSTDLVPVLQDFNGSFRSISITSLTKGK